MCCAVGFWTLLLDTFKVCIVRLLSIINIKCSHFCLILVSIFTKVSDRVRSLLNHVIIIRIVRFRFLLALSLSIGSLILIRCTIIIVICNCKLLWCCKAFLSLSIVVEFLQAIYTMNHWDLEGSSDGWLTFSFLLC